MQTLVSHLTALFKGAAGRPTNKVWEDMAMAFAEKLDRIEVRVQETQEKVHALWDTQDHTDDFPGGPT